MEYVSPYLFFGGGSPRTGRGGVAGGRAGTARSVEASAGPGNCAASTCHGQKTHC